MIYIVAERLEAVGRPMFGHGCKLMSRDFTTFTLMPHFNLTFSPRLSYKVPVLSPSLTKVRVFRFASYFSAVVAAVIVVVVVAES